MQKYLVLNCSRTTATLIIFATISLFILIGCASLFRSAGLTDEQAAAQTTELKSALEDAAASAITDIQTDLTEGHDLKTIALKTSSAFLWKIIAAAGASVGVVLNGLLAKWLGTEKKINRVLITSIEDADNDSVKKRVKALSKDAGINSKLAARVKALT